MTSRAAIAALTLAAGALVSACTAGPTGSGAPGLVTHLSYRYLTDLGNGAVDHAYGYNLVDLGPYRSVIDALPAGERALVWIGNYSPARCAFDMSDANVRQALGTLAGDPKVAGYYLADEADDALPTYGGHCPDVATQVTQRSRLIHQLAPGAFTYEVVTEPGNFAAFAHATDVMGADPYPCLRGHACDWAKIPEYIAALNAAHVPRYWGLLQAFGYGKWRAPTVAELARMIGQWAHSRWQGEQTFSWNYLSWSLKSHPDLLAVLKSLNAGNTAATGPASGPRSRRHGSAGAHIRAHPGVHIDRRGLLRPGQRGGLGVVRHRLQHHHPLAGGDHQHRHRPADRHLRDQLTGTEAERLCRVGEGPPAEGGSGHCLRVRKRPYLRPGHHHPDGHGQRGPADRAVRHPGKFGCDRAGGILPPSRSAARSPHGCRSASCRSRPRAIRPRPSTGHRAGRSISRRPCGGS